MNTTKASYLDVYRYSDGQFLGQILAGPNLAKYEAMREGEEGLVRAGDWLPESIWRALDPDIEADTVVYAEEV